MRGDALRARNQAHLWQVAQAHGSFTVHELSGAAKRSVDYVRAELRGWQADGFVEKAGKRGMSILWRVTEAPGAPVTATGSRTPEERMWFALRKAGGVFSAADLAMWTNTDEVPVSVDDAQAYCRLLLRAGYVRCEIKADGRGRMASYRLIQNTGPRAPVERRVRAVWDPNTEDFKLHSGRVS